MKPGKYKTLLICPYFGPLPAWMEYFLQSCAYNPSYNWLIYSDAKKPSFLPQNVLFVKKSIKDFNQLASDNLQLTIRITNPYKICDLRPAFGIIFKDFTKDYEFWGSTDIDLIYGNIDYFIKPMILRSFDIISVKKEYLPGHFTLYRNTPYINNLYKKIKGHQKIFSDNNNHYAFDERSNIIGKRIFSDNKLNSSFHEPKIIFNNFWHKIFMILKKKSIVDITGLVLSLEEQTMVSVYRENLVRSDNWYLKQNFHNWNINWKEGSIYDEENNHQLLHFHFLISKNYPDFIIETFKPGKSFRISREGFSYSP